MGALRRIAIASAFAALTANAAAMPAPAAAKGDISILDASAEALGYRGAAARESAFRDLDTLGADSVRLLVFWKDVVPGPRKLRAPQGFNPRDSTTYGKNGVLWAGVDMAVRMAAARGIGVYLVASGGPRNAAIPRWASRTPRAGATNPDPQAYRNFLQAIGSRYRGGFDPDGVGFQSPLPRVAMVGAYNEPNNANFLLPQRRKGKLVSPKRYRKLAIGAARGLAAGGWRGRLLIGETSSQGVGPNPDPLTFLRGTLCLNRRYKQRKKCGKLDADGWAMHPYALSYAPWEKPPGANKVAIGSLGRLSRALKAAGRARAVRKKLPIYVSEFGYESYPDRYAGLSLRRHAEYLSTAEWIAHRNKRVVSFAQYLLHDDPKSFGPGGFQSGLRFPSDKAKPAYHAYRLPLAARRKGGKVKLWGRVRPATGPTTAVIRFKDRGKRPRRLGRVRTKGSGYLGLKTKYRPGRRYSLAWRGFKGPFIRAYGW